MHSAALGINIGIDGRISPVVVLRLIAKKLVFNLVSGDYSYPFKDNEFYPVEDDHFEVLEELVDVPEIDEMNAFYLQEVKKDRKVELFEIFKQFGLDKWLVSTIVEREFETHSDFVLRADITYYDDISIRFGILPKQLDFEEHSLYDFTECKKYNYQDILYIGHGTYEYYMVYVMAVGDYGHDDNITYPQIAYEDIAKIAVLLKELQQSGRLSKEVDLNLHLYWD